MTESIRFIIPDLDLGAFIPYAHIDIDGEQICLEGVHSASAVATYQTTFGARSYRTYRTTDDRYAGLVLHTGVYLWEEAHRMLISQKIENRSGKDVYFVSAGIRVPDAPAFGSDWVLSSIHAKPEHDVEPNGERNMDETLAVFNKDSRKGLLIMPVNAPEAFIKICFREDMNHMALRVESDMCSVLVANGENRKAQDVLWQ